MNKLYILLFDAQNEKRHLKELPKLNTNELVKEGYVYKSNGYSRHLCVWVIYLINH